MAKLNSSRFITVAALSSLICGGVLVAALPAQSNGGQPAEAAPKATSIAPAPKEDKSSESTFSQEEITKLSEAFGHFIGRNLNNPGIKFDLDSIITGMRNGVAGKPAPMSDQEYEKMMGKLQEYAYRQLAEENLKAANEFIEKNKSEKGVIELQPGKLQYLVIAEGSGAAVEKGNAPQIKYVGKYIDGSVFGNSDEAGGAITVPLDQTIQGFSQGLLGMKEGEKRRLFVHPDVGYGTMGQLPPNALLIFDVEVLKANNTSPKSGSFSKTDGAANGMNEEDGAEDHLSAADFEDEEDVNFDDEGDEELDYDDESDD